MRLDIFKLKSVIIYWNLLRKHLLEFYELIYSQNFLADAIYISNNNIKSIF